MATDKKVTDQNDKKTAATKITTVPKRQLCPTPNWQHAKMVGDPKQ